MTINTNPKILGNPNWHSSASVNEGRYSSKTLTVLANPCCFHIFIYLMENNTRVWYISQVFNSICQLVPNSNILSRTTKTSASSSHKCMNLMLYLYPTTPGIFLDSGHGHHFPNSLHIFPHSCICIYI
ncbi:hypothetical protein V8G54_011132 [Vigna mungo]|uniref:Uncharacterized protein n=1 Tax=Vigna mungo TaxID=3915 RepID=A0AAQ3NRF1_VIGMU